MDDHGSAVALTKWLMTSLLASSSQLWLLKGLWSHQALPFPWTIPTQHCFRMDYNSPPGLINFVQDPWPSFKQDWQFCRICWKNSWKWWRYHGDSFCKRFSRENITTLQNEAPRYRHHFHFDFFNWIRQNYSILLESLAKGSWT